MQLLLWRVLSTSFRRTQSSLLISAPGVQAALAARWRSGCSDEHSCGRAFRSAVQQSWLQQGCGELVADHRLVDAGSARRGSGGVLEGVVASVFETLW